MVDGTKAILASAKLSFGCRVMQILLSFCFQKKPIVLWSALLAKVTRLNDANTEAPRVPFDRGHTDLAATLAYIRNSMMCLGTQQCEST